MNSIQIRYRYFPQKSNVWGHSLRNLRPSIMEKNVNDFLKTLSVNIKDARYYLRFFVLPNAGLPERNEYKTLVDLLVNSLVVKDYEEGQTSSITEVQFEKGLKLLKKIESKARHRWVGATLERSLTIDRWVIDKEPVPTEAALGFSYGFSPSIGTEFILNNAAEFPFLARQFHTHFKVRLNPKHFKPLKAAMKNYHLWK